MQMQELLGKVKSIRNPVVIAGDLNTTLSKGRPRGVKDTVTAKMGDTSFWIGQGVKYGTGVGAVYGMLVGGYKNIRFQDDPTASGIKYIADNPEKALFDKVGGFRFDDGTAIDFRGIKQKTATGNSGTLADSNQRDAKGFVTTFQFQRTIGPKGKFKLDWIFVKSYLKDPADERGPYAFAPHFARALVETNYAPSERMSDHTPISVDLPFTEPPPVH
jgi:hypothetical protein